MLYVHAKTEGGESRIFSAFSPTGRKGRKKRPAETDEQKKKNTQLSCANKTRLWKPQGSRENETLAHTQKNKNNNGVRDCFLTGVQYTYNRVLLKIDKSCASRA